ncbi:glycoside hydrolase family 3 N-terminal domain-containing protein [Fructilactobacillus vespulae]|uniref:glycoside hydrolase family 3 N-terminal domain-containing protein n=1 Tax=Fructilactobacillus vespulae TaxID=1249630 RepID=UPI0039B693B6
MSEFKRIKTKSIQEYEILHKKQLRELAPESTLFLRRSGKFPLAGINEIALYGSGVRHTVKGGTGSGNVNVRKFNNIEDVFEAENVKVLNKAWLDSFDEVLQKGKVKFEASLRKEAEANGIPFELYAMGKGMPALDYEIPLEKKGSTAIYVLSRVSGEFSDRENIEGDIKLSSNEISEITKLNQLYDNFLLVLNTSSFIDLSPLSAVKDILLLGQLGIVTSEVLYDILVGKAYPSGKLTSTWANLADYPSTKTFGSQDDTVYNEGVFVGYRYFDTFNRPVVFPFGYGLGYTDFEIKVDPITLEQKSVHIPVKVINQGDFAGKEVVQVYVAQKQANHNYYQKLVAFKKSQALAPGETEQVNIELDLTQLATYDEAKSAWEIKQGNYLLKVGNQSRDGQAVANLLVEEDILIEQVKGIKTTDFVEEIKSETAKGEQVTNDLVTLKVNPASFTPLDGYSENDEKELVFEKKNANVTFDQVMKNEASLQDLVASLSDTELAYLCVGNFNENSQSIAEIVGDASTVIAGGAGETTKKLSDKKVPQINMADGPAGLRINQVYQLDKNQSVSKELVPGRENYYQFTTAIPIGTSLAQSWNLEFVNICGKIISTEMSIFGVDIMLTPAMNIQRSPLCGRNFEYYSEDPYVSGKMAAALINGIQSIKGHSATLKHYAAYNQETNRMHSNSILSEKALREIYLKAFQIAIKESAPATIMTSYNLINGIHTANDYELIHNILRKEFGFKGLVMSDWLTTTSFPGDDLKKYPISSSSLCIKAGNDLIMPGTKEDIEGILAGLRQKHELTLRDLQVSAYRVLKLIYDTSR